MSVPESLFGSSVQSLWSRRGKSQRTRRVVANATSALLTTGTGDAVGKTSAEITVLMGQAEESFVRGDFESVISLLSSITKKAPTMPEPYSMLALMYAERGYPAQALQLYVLAASFSPKNIELWSRVLAFAMDISEYGQALIAVNRCIKLTPETSSSSSFDDYHILRIVILIKMGKIPLSFEAIAHYRQRNPADLKSLIRVGEVYLEEGIKSAAMNCFQAFLRDCFLPPFAIKPLISASRDELEWLGAQMESGLLYHTVKQNCLVLLSFNSFEIPQAPPSPVDLQALIDLLESLFELFHSVSAMHPPVMTTAEFPNELFLLLGCAKLILGGESSHA